MKSVRVTGNMTTIAKNIDNEPNNTRSILFFADDDALQVSDGSHTMDELYRHRYALFISICRLYANLEKYAPQEINILKGVLVTKRLKTTRVVWRSMLHYDQADNPMHLGYFILGIGKKKGQQVSYHLPLEYWTATDFAESLETSPKWDGHTPEDVIKRLNNL